MNGVQIRASAAWLRPVLTNWHGLVEAACLAFPQTATARFLEESFVGLLATAAWQAGFPAILQAKCTRAGQSQSNKHLDLLMQGAEGYAGFEGKVDYVAETRFSHRLCTALAAALDDATRCGHPLAQRYYGVAFASMFDYDPSIALRDVLTATLQHLETHYPALDALAGVLCDHPGATYRGCILAAQEVSRAVGSGGSLGAA